MHYLLFGKYHINVHLSIYDAELTYYDAELTYYSECGVSLNLFHILKCVTHRYLSDFSA